MKKSIQITIDFSPICEYTHTRFTVYELVVKMNIHRLKGGEFYAESNCKNRAMCAKQWDSSNKQHGSVGSISMPNAVAARIAMKARAFSFPLNSLTVRRYSST